MNTEHIEKFVNAIACDLEEGGFRQVSGTTLRRSLTEAVSAALPLLADTGIPASQPAELSFDVEAMLTACVPGGNIVDPQVVADNIRAWFADRKPAELAEQQEVMLGAVVEAICYDEHGVQIANVSPVVRERIRRALAATGKQQVGEVQGDALAALVVKWRARQEEYDNQQSAESKKGYEVDWTPDAKARSFECAADELEAALAARQPGAQVPYGWLISGHAGGPMFCPASHRHVMEANATDLSKEIGITIVEVYAAPTAHGIDLGPLVDAMNKAENLLRKTGKFSRASVMGTLLEPVVSALIDSQRDAAPGVES